MKAKQIGGISYSLPKVYLLQHTGIGVAEYAARTCYDSFDNSEHEEVKQANISASDGSLNHFELYQLNLIESSDLLDTLAWTHFHHSILEHANLSYLVKGTSRGVLQEHARHRIQAISVRSTRYTMNSVINAFIASRTLGEFSKLIKTLNMFVVSDIAEDIEIRHLYEKLEIQFEELGTEEFYKIALAKDNLEYLRKQKEERGEMNNPNVHTPEQRFKTLGSNKQKRNVGDSFKWVVTDNWKVDMVVTMNLRALKNYLELRNSDAAYHGIRWLAQAIMEATPKKYLSLVNKKYKG